MLWIWEQKNAVLVLLLVQSRFYGGKRAANLELQLHPTKENAGGMTS